MSFVLVGDMFEGSAGDELGLFAQGSGVELGGGSGGVEVQAPADFVRHPIADAGKVFLVENERFEAGARALGQ